MDIGIPGERDTRYKTRSKQTMKTYNIHEAKAQLSKLVEQAAKGESFVIAKAGKPMVKVTALDTPEPSQTKRFGFMAGQLQVPDDFNTMGARKVQKLFERGT
jgi:prevent-host-death family protein